MSDRCDVAVIGAGFGGLGAALELARSGQRVVVLETLDYPGGCAGSFERDGYRFEAGATLFSGLDAGQLFGRWIEEHDLPVEVDWVDPIITLRTDAFAVPVGPDRDAVTDAFCAMPGAPRRGVRRYFDFQASIADTLWRVMEQPELLPPLDVGGLRAHAGMIPRYLPLVSLAGAPLTRVLSRFGVDEFPPLRLYLDALCQITVQCSASEAEAPFALAAADYCHRGAGHIRGGVGELAKGLVEAIRACGSEVRLLDRVKRLTPSGDGFRLETRRGVLEADEVIANVLPQNLEKLLGRGTRALARLSRRIASGWGAIMLYRVVRSRAPIAAGHFQVVQDPSRPFIEGNHLFASMSGPGEARPDDPELRTVTVSTHVDLPKLLELEREARGRRVAEIQDLMRAGLARFVPECSEDVVHEMTASPRTFQRFTGRHEGFVGGVPRRHGLGNYTGMGPTQVAPGLHLVGDSVFPGQSALATAIGGQRLATRLLRHAGNRR